MDYRANGMDSDAKLLATDERVVTRHHHIGQARRLASTTVCDVKVEQVAEDKDKHYHYDSSNSYEISAQTTKSKRDSSLFGNKIDLIAAGVACEYSDKTVEDITTTLATQVIRSNLISAKSKSPPVARKAEYTCGLSGTISNMSQPRANTIRKQLRPPPVVVSDAYSCEQQPGTSREPLKYILNSCQHHQLEQRHAFCRLRVALVLACALVSLALTASGKQLTIFGPSAPARTNKERVSARAQSASGLFSSPTSPDQMIRPD